MRAAPWIRRLFALMALVGAVGMTLAQGAAQTQPDAGGDGRVAILAAVEGPIGPATVRHVEQTLEEARERNAAFVILRLNTPGGLADSMREIIADILASTVPVVGFVAPPGAHAASAGTYILYATHIAAMAPGTNLGAATPVQIGGGGLPGQPDRQPDGAEGEEEGGNGETDQPAPPQDAMSAKAVNDSVAFIRSLAELRGRNAEWAEKAVREAASLSASAAREQDVIEIVARDVDALLAELDGRTVTVNGVERTLETEGLRIERYDPGIVTQLLALLANPNVALILMMIGVYGLIFEFANPGGVGPGIIGAICLILGLYALNQLPLDYAGLGLILLGIALMVAEVFTPTFGVLGLGGLVAFVIGAAMLIDTDIPAFQLSWWVIAGVAAASAAFLVFVLGYAWRAHRHPVQSGAQQLVGSQARVVEWSGTEGHVWAHGERWRARGTRAFAPGQRVRILGLDGLTLRVEPEQSGEPAQADQQRGPAGQGD